MRLLRCRAALDESRINAAQAVEKHARRALRQTLMKAATEHASECPFHNPLYSCLIGSATNRCTTFLKGYTLKAANFAGLKQAAWTPCLTVDALSAEEKQLVTARLAEKQKEALAKKAEEAQMKLLEEERTREERRQVSTPLTWLPECKPCTDCVALSVC